MWATENILTSIYHVSHGRPGSVNIKNNWILESYNLVREQRKEQILLCIKLTQYVFSFSSFPFFSYKHLLNKLKKCLLISYYVPIILMSGSYSHGFYFSVGWGVGEREKERIKQIIVLDQDKCYENKQSHMKSDGSYCNWVIREGLCDKVPQVTSAATRDKKPCEHTEEEQLQRPWAQNQLSNRMNTND